MAPLIVIELRTIPFTAWPPAWTGPSHASLHAAARSFCVHAAPNLPLKVSLAFLGRIPGTSTSTWINSYRPCGRLDSVHV
eukprot:344616-Amphidinium_carterae.1